MTNLEVDLNSNTEDLPYHREYLELLIVPEQYIKMYLFFVLNSSRKLEMCFLVYECA